VVRAMVPWAAILLTLAPASARAHLGLGPVANAIVVEDDDARHLAVSTNFGVLESRDGGASFAWVCAVAIDASAYAEEPPVVPTRDGVLVGTFFEGLREWTGTPSCAVEPIVDAPLAGRYVAALTPDGTGRVLGVTADGGRDNVVVVVHGPASPSVLGAPLPDTLLSSVVSVGGTLLVTGIVLDARGTPAEGIAWAFDPDSGDATPRARVPLARGEQSFRVLAHDETRVWAVVRGIDVDRLLLSPDAGSSFEEVLRARAIDGVALHEGRVYAALARDGVAVSEDGRAFVPPREMDPGLVALCIASVGGALWICGEPAAGGPLLAEIDASAHVIREILRIDDAPATPDGCAALAAECAPWAEELRSTLRAADAGTLDAGATDDDAAPADAGIAATAPASCACAAGHDPAPSLVVGALVCVAFALARRPRRRGR